MTFALPSSGGKSGIKSTNIVFASSCVSCTLSSISIPSMPSSPSILLIKSTASVVVWIEYLFHFICFLHSYKHLHMQESFVTSVGFVKVCLADNFKRCVHVLYGNAAVNDIHAIIAHNISNGSAAACIDLAKF